MFFRPAKWFLTVSVLSILPLVLALGCCKGESEPAPDPIATVADPIDPIATPDPVAPPTAIDPLAIDTTTTPTTVPKPITVRDATPTKDDPSKTFGKTGAAEKAAAEKAAADKAAADKAAADKAAADKAAAEAAAAAAKAAKSNVAYRGNRKTRVFHAPGCSDYRCENCTVVLVGKDRAKAAGYRAHSCVK